MIQWAVKPISCLPPCSLKGPCFIGVPTGCRRLPTFLLKMKLLGLERGNPCSVARITHFFLLLQEKKTCSPGPDQQPWRPGPPRADLVKAPKPEMPQGLGQEVRQQVLASKELADKGRLDLSCSASLGVGLTSSSLCVAPFLPAAEELRDGGLLPALGSRLPGPPQPRAQAHC